MKGYLPVFKAIYLLCINLYAEFPFLNWEGWNIYNTLRYDGGGSIWEYAPSIHIFIHQEQRHNYLEEKRKVCLFDVSIVSPDMLFHGLFIASSPKYILETLTGIQNGQIQLTAIVRLSQSFHFDFTFLISSLFE